MALPKHRFFWGRVTRDSFHFPGGAQIDGSLFFLSNFFPCRFELDGRLWRSSEHYYQAMKFADTDHEHFEAIYRAATPAKAATLGRTHPQTLDPKWDEKKDDVMLDALRAKFGQNPALRAQLRETGNAILHEDAKTDYYWGVGRVTKAGQDKLGKLLMQVRSELCD